MAKLTPNDFQTRDIYMFFGFENATLRYDHKTGKKYVRFLGKTTETEHPTESKFANDIRAFGIEITKEEYDSGVIDPDREINPK